MASTERLTPHFLGTTLAPFLNAVADIQSVIDEAQGETRSEVAVKVIRQNSPISITLEGASKAVQEIKDLVVPWRRRHQEKLARLLEQEKKVEIESKKAEILEKQAKVAKDRAEAEKVSAEAAKQREETKRMMLENEKLRLEVQRAKIQMALEVLTQVAPNLPETEKIAYVVKLLPPLDIVTSSELEIGDTVSDQLVV